MVRAGLVLALLALGGSVYAQKLNWKPEEGHRPFNVIYGQITVLVDEPGTSYCGADWWASHPAAGNMGIQSEERDHKSVTFSIWPTDKGDNAYPLVAKTNPHLTYTLAKNDVHGSHIDANYRWPVRTTFQFYATKGIDERTGGVVISLFFYDEERRSWVGEGRILSPVDGKKNIDNFEWLTSSMENQKPKNNPNRDVPRLALFRLWAGSGPDDLQMITTAKGDGEWGTMNGAFFLAIGSSFEVDRAIIKDLEPGTQAVPGRNRKEKLEIPAQAVPENVVRALKELG